VKAARIVKLAHAPQQLSSRQGFILLDALIAVVIFSIGILGLVALQSSAIKLAGDAKYRTDAAMLADQVIAEMWANNAVSRAAFVTQYTGGSGANGAAYTLWANTVDCTSKTAATGCLPGVTANPPVITVTPIASDTNDSLVKVTVKWQAPNDTGPHSYVSITQIGI
jgi:type IV pilus assembly protein PilV